MKLSKIDQYIRSVELNRHEIFSFSDYSFCLPAIVDLKVLNFHPKITFIVGENGTGKSTI